VHAFLYTGGKLIDLAPLLADTNTLSRAVAINDSGQVLGWGPLADGLGTYNGLFLYSDGAISPLIARGQSGSGTGSINNSGQIVATLGLVGGLGVYPCAYSAGAWSPLVGTNWSPLLGTNYGNAKAINASGQVVGTGSYGNKNAFLTGGGITTYWGDTNDSITPFGMNDGGEVVGTMTVPAGGGLTSVGAFLFQSGVLTALNPVGGFQSSQGYGINNAGEVVGYGVLTNGAGMEFLYSGGAFIDLNSQIDGGGRINPPKAINDLGQIAGVTPSGQVCLLTPIQQSRPSLKIVSAGANVLISWPTNAAGFNLYSNFVLGLPNWQVVTNQPTVSGDQNQVVVPGPLAGNCFYRLISQ
jgi:probable HAF family extracellular repeat protein